MLVEAELGGLEADPLTWLEALEELAAAEASVAWVVWNCASPILFGQYLGDEQRTRFFGNASDLYASSTRVTGRAAVGDDGYGVTGRWSLVSGCMHAAALAFLCQVTKDGEPLRADTGAPVLRMVFLSRDDGTIIDTWHVGGLRGTGSHDVTLDDLAVPADCTVSPFDDTRIDRPLGRMPMAVTMSAGHGALCLGVARGALEDVLELGRTKVPVDPVPAMRDRAANQRRVAETAAQIESARAHLHDVLAAGWARAEAGDPMTPEVLADLWIASVNASHTSRTAVNAMHEMGGTTALYTDCFLERRHRDIHAMLNHIICQPLWFEQAGAVKLGLEPTNPLFAI
jgi:alkylation response protein AidB-like acyl-CoA dehydrogenase